MKDKYFYTESACRITIFSQALIINVLPLLFVIFSTVYGVDTIRLTLLIGVTFGVQLLFDATASTITKLLGYRGAALSATGFSSIGLIMLGTLPHIMSNTYVALIISNLIMSIGAGLMEVIVSPISNSLPSANRNSGLCLLHSFYCWGHLGVIIVTTIFVTFLKELWWILPLAYAFVPFFAFVLFTFSPIIEDKTLKSGEKLPSLFKNKFYWITLIMMICVGSIEQSIAQWSAYFAEAGLGVSPAVGNLVGPAIFALCMGIMRLLTGLKKEKFKPVKTMFVCSIGAFISFLLVSLSPIPILSLVGCGLMGVFIGPGWPTVLTIAQERIPNNHTKLFAYLALFGDTGCLIGPGIVGGLTAICESTGITMPFSTSLTESGLKLGLIACSLLAVTMCICCIILLKKRKTNNN